MNPASLSHDLFEVRDGSRVISYGGSQSLYENRKTRALGCGIAGSASVILYMEALKNNAFSITRDRFFALSNELKKYMPIIPGLGVNAYVIAFGLNRYFKKHGLGYHARWNFLPFGKWKNMERMLKNDIPVILAIGLNFPKVWGKRELDLYEKTGGQGETADRSLKRYCSVRGHFVVVTGMNKDLLTISSWGKKLYIKIDEFKKYVLKYSTHLYSNIVVIKKNR